MMKKSIYWKAWRLKNLEKRRAFEREFQREFRKRKGYHNERNSKLRYPEKTRARNVVASAIARGKLQRLPCEVCGDLKSQAHHKDYAKPLDVIFLCVRHHAEAEGRASIPTPSS